mmetsp:Transcript_16723/g.30283  ORF Transcript_16723/g.30283 Transcript_16723/m.30283 type:complete len:160 (+) Transcript_16723:144-623(+)
MGRIETEDVPEEKRMHQSSRENSNYKWLKGNVIGALEVASEPELDYNEELVAHAGKTEDRDAWVRAEGAWETLKLHSSFISACNDIGKETCFCGLVTDGEGTKKTLVKELNKTWAKEANEKLASFDTKVDLFIWHWSNISGKSQSKVILIRFHDTTKSS